jgi:hypothetical protein
MVSFLDVFDKAREVTAMGPVLQSFGKTSSRRCNREVRPLGGENPDMQAAQIIDGQTIIFCFATWKSSIHAIKIW